MKILESNMLEKHEDIEYHYIFHDLVTHKVANEIHYAISKTNYFMSDESFYKQHEMLQEGVNGKDFKDQASVINHIAILNKRQLKFAESKRKELQNFSKNFAIQKIKRLLFKKQFLNYTSPFFLQVSQRQLHF